MREQIEGLAERIERLERAVAARDQEITYPSLVRLERLAQRAAAIATAASELEDELGRLIVDLSGLDLPRESHELAELHERLDRDA